jgi:histo-blood group ABO system transferase
MNAFILITNTKELLQTEKFISNFMKTINLNEKYVLYVLINYSKYGLYIKKKYDYNIVCYYYEDNFNFEDFLKTIDKHNFYYLVKNVKCLETNINAIDLYYIDEFNYYTFEKNIISCSYSNLYDYFKDVMTKNEYITVFDNIDSKLILHQKNNTVKHKIFCNLMGGLGNLLFIIFTTISYCIENNYKFIWIIENINGEDTTRKKMNEYKIFSNFEYVNLIDFEYDNYYEKSYFYEKMNVSNTNLKLNGYFQSCHYFYDNISHIKKMLNFDFFKDKMHTVYNNISFNHLYTVSVHVRRTDYLKFQLVHHNQSIIYYEKAFEYFDENALFLIFSDDINWCKTQPLFLNNNCKFIENENEEESLYLMSLCNHNICANSSFSLWASYLNENNGITFIPHKWFGINGPKYNLYDLIPKNKSFITLNDEIDENYDKIIKFEKNNLIFLNHIKLKEIYKNNTIGIILICTGKYIGYVKNTIKKINDKFLINYNKIYYIITDNTNFFNDITTKYNVVLQHIYKKGFPNDTLYRYNYMLLVKEHLDKNTQYMFYFDVDMDIEDYVFENILPDINTPLLGTRHPGFIMQHPFQYSYGSPEMNPLSTAYIPPEKRINNYIAGGFNGGITKYFLKMAKHIDDNIKIDDKNNVIAIWHDESHLNNYYTFNENLFKILQPEYCYPQHLKSDLTPKIIALDKKHNEVRFSDVYISCDENDDFWKNLFHVFTILHIAHNLNLTPIFTLSYRSPLYFNLQYNQHYEIEYDYIDDVKNIDITKNTKLNIDFMDIQNTGNFIANKNITKRFNVDCYNVYEKYNISLNKKLFCIHLGEHEDYYIKILNKIKHKNNHYVFITVQNKEYAFYNKYSNYNVIECKDDYDFLRISNSFKNIIVANNFKSFWACVFSENIQNIYLSKNFETKQYFEILEKKVLSY